MYFRDDKGIIGKLLDIENYNNYYNNKIIKSSHNIIDLIEVGDYVNGDRVEQDCSTLGTYSETVDLYFQSLKEIDKYPGIKSIVTKEQFAQMEYVVNND